MPRESRKQQIFKATLSVVEKTCALHTRAKNLLHEIEPTHGNADAYDALASLVEEMAEHVEEVGSMAAVVDLSMTRVVITHFKTLGTRYESAATPVRAPELPSADPGNVPDFEVVDEAAPLVPDDA